MQPIARYFLPRAVFAAIAALGLAGCAEGTGLGLNMVPEDQVRQMGLETWRTLRAESPESTDDAYRREAREVSQRLIAAAGGRAEEWEVVVFAGDEINAFALPGGKIGIYEGMFTIADTPDKLAAVIAHEIAHVQQGHAQQRVNTELGTQLGVQAAGAAAGAAGLGSPEMVATVLGAGARYGLTLPYSRNQELESDRLGLNLMARAGYDPRAAVELWQDMAAAGGDGPPAFMSTHPVPETRIEAIRGLLPEAMEIYRRRS